MLLVIIQVRNIGDLGHDGDSREVGKSGQPDFEYFFLEHFITEIWICYESRTVRGYIGAIE